MAPTTLPKEFIELLSILKFYKSRISDEIKNIENDNSRDHWYLHNIIETRDRCVRNYSENVGYLYAEYNIKYYSQYRDFSQDS